jgi:catechol 2,3-dioxygenase-like lactoylglutathione lyase family enzyme
MPPKNPDQHVEFTFVLHGVDYPIQERRGAIVHEAFHVALPTEYTAGHRLVFRTLDGREIYPDNFLGDLVDHLEVDRIETFAEPIPAAAGSWRNIGFDHLAISVEDRPGARDFLRDVVQMKVMRDDPHLTVLTTGPTTIMLFDTGEGGPLSTGGASRWHHLGFVVDDLSAAYAHLQKNRDRLISDFTMLERDERWSLYFFYRNGDVTFMFQFSEVKEADRGITDPSRSDFANYLFDYAKRPYGVQWELELAGSESR